MADTEDIQKELSMLADKYDSYFWIMKKMVEYGDLTEGIMCHIKTIFPLLENNTMLMLETALSRQERKFKEED